MGTRQNRMYRIVFIGLALIVTLSHGEASRGEVQVLNLPADYADFALHPETGTIAALSAETNEAVFFRGDDLATGSTQPAAKVRVGSTPCSVVYKRYQDKRFFAIVCSQDSHMYLVDAGSTGGESDAEFALMAKVELNQSGVSYVTAALNPDDPFVYYCFGAGHGSKTGVVSLRDMRNHGVAFDDSMDCAISASGEVAYRRGPWSPSGFESLIRTSSLSDDKPVFSRLFYDHNSTAQYYPDPFDRYTAAGSKIFSRSLEKHEASLDFVPLCFFQTRPVIVGIAGGDASVQIRARTGGKHDQRIALRAASYNTFTNFGDQVTLEQAPSAGERALPRGIPSPADYKRVAKRVRLFADDIRGRVVYADGSRLILVPLEEFDLPDEPILLARLEGTRQVVVEQENWLELELLDPRVEVTLNDMPDGMDADGNRLTWKPTAQQVGSAAVVATLKHSDIQRTLQFDLDVTFPSRTLPFAPTGFAIDSTGTRAVVWEGAALNNFGWPQENSSTATTSLGVLNLQSGKLEAQRQVADQIGIAFVTADYVVVRPAQSSSPKVEILSLDDLERKKTLVASGPILRLEIVENLLVIETQSGIEIFDTSSFDRLIAFDAAGGPNTAAVSQHGLFVSGVLYGFDLKPKLIVHPGPIPSLGGETAAGLPSFARKAAVAQGNQQQPYGRQMPNREGQTRVATETIPGTNVQVSLDVRRQPIEVRGATHTWRAELEIALTASGSVDARQVLMRHLLHSQTFDHAQTAPPILQVAQRGAFVVYGKNLYHWQIPLPEAKASQQAEPMSWLPEQSSLVLNADGTTQLKHTLQGGKPPVQYSTLNLLEAVTVEEATGTVTVDNAAIVAEAIKVVERWTEQRNRGEPLVQTLRSQVDLIVGHAKHVLGQQPTGVPVAVPIQVTASDRDLADATLHYFVITEIPLATLSERLQALEAEREKQRMEAQAAREQARLQSNLPPSNASADELTGLKRRVDALEQRLDLITRQLNLLLKKLDEQNP